MCDIPKKKILIDECLSPDYLEKLSEILDMDGYMIIHVGRDKFLRGKQDRFLAQFMNKHSFYALLTCDDGFIWSILDGRAGYRMDNDFKVMPVIQIPEEDDISDIVEFLEHESLE